MSRKGDCWHNAVTETLFGSLKIERLHGMRFYTHRQAKDEVWTDFSFTIVAGFIRRWDISAQWHLRKNSSAMTRLSPHDG